MPTQDAGWLAFGFTQIKENSMIISGLTAVEAAQMLTKEVYENPTKLYESVDTRLVRSLEKLGVIKFKEERNELKELLEYHLGTKSTITKILAEHGYKIIKVDK